MKNYNTGLVLSYEEFIHDKKEAAKQFAEGDNSLENLLNFCFDNNIITKACCKGHKEIPSLPYFAFSFCKQNEIYLQSLLYFFKDKECDIEYIKNENGNSIFVFYENKNFNFSNHTNLFNEILLCLQNTNKHINYFELLPNDLKNFYCYCVYSETDENLCKDGSEEYHSIEYTNRSSKICYKFITSKYKKYIKQSQIKQINIDTFKIIDKNRELISLKLELLNYYIFNNQLNDSNKKILIKK